MSNFVRIKDGINLGSLTSDPVVANKGDVYFNITTNQLKMFDGTTWGTPILMSEKAAANGVATLDAAGKIPNSQIPAIAITDTFVVADESAMLALSTAETGDVAIRTDVSRCFILAGTNPAILADWKELLTPEVGGLAKGPFNLVNGQAIPSPITNLSIDKNLSKAAKLDYTIRRNHIGSNFIGGGSDTAFNANLGEGLYRLGNADVVDTVYSPAGDYILAIGNFNKTQTTSARGIAYLNSNGEINLTMTNAVGTGFSHTNGFPYPRSVAMQSDGKAVIVGFFDSFNGTPCNQLVRLNTDGTVDAAFMANLGTSFSMFDFVSWVEISPVDQKIVIGCGTSTFNGTTVYGILRLNVDGTLDTTFTNNIGTGFNNSVETLKVQSDGKIVVCGNFNSFNGTSCGYFTRLNSDGTLDLTFSANAGTGFDNTVRRLTILSDGRIACVGFFNTYNTLNAGGVAVINADGTQDTAWYANAQPRNYEYFYYSVVSDSLDNIYASGFSYVYKYSSTGIYDLSYNNNQLTQLQNSQASMTISPTTDFLLVGTSYQTNKNNRLLLYDTTGTEVISFFNNQGGGFVREENPYETGIIEVQSDGKILVGGGFTHFNGTFTSAILRLNPDGTLDTDFTNNIGTGIGTNFVHVDVIVVQPDGKILVGGNFSIFNGVSCANLVRLNDDGTLDTAFVNNLGAGFNGNVRTIGLQSNGDILVGGDFNTFRGISSNYIVGLDSFGNQSPTFNIGSGFNSSVRTIAIQPDNKVLVGGFFSSYNGFTSNGLVRLDSVGAIETNFTNNLGNGFTSGGVFDLEIANDGSIFVCGGFNFVNGQVRPALTKLLPSGLEDSNFVLGLGTGFQQYQTAYAVSLDPQGNIYLAGGIGNYQGIYVGGFMKMSPTGVFDSAFQANLSPIPQNGYLEYARYTPQGLYILSNFLPNSPSRAITRRLNSNIVPDVKAAKTGQLFLAYNDELNVWEIGAEVSMGADPGVTLSVDLTGQVQYTSTLLGGTLQDSYIKWILNKI